MKTLFYFLLSVLIVACGTNNQSDEFSDERLNQLALEQGGKIAATAKKALGGQLKTALSEGGPVFAVGFCNTAAYPILDTIETAVPAKIKRAALRLRNPNDAPTEIEREILEHFSNLLESGSRIEPFTREAGKDEILFAAPIMLDNPLCLNCHGEPGTQITEETYEKIKELYPQDEASGHSMGDLRGIWSITFKREDLASYLRETSSR